MMDDGSLKQLKDRLHAAEELLRADDKLVSREDLARARDHLQSALDTLAEWLAPPDPYASTALRPGLQREGHDHG